MKEMLFKILKLIIISILGIFFLNKFNLFSHISFVPSDQAYNIGITMYFSVLGLIIDTCVGYFNLYFKSKLTVILFLPSTVESIDSTPIIRFNNQDLAEINIKVNINGRKKHFLKSKILIKNINIATMQVSGRSQEAVIDQNGNYSIDLAELFGNEDKKTNISCNFRLTFIKEPFIEGYREVELLPCMHNDTFGGLNLFVNCKHNHSKISVEE